MARTDLGREHEIFQERVWKEVAYSDDGSASKKLVSVAPSLFAPFVS